MKQAKRMLTSMLLSQVVSIMQIIPNESHAHTFPNLQVCFYRIITCSSLSLLQHIVKLSGLLCRVAPSYLHMDITDKCTIPT